MDTVFGVGNWNDLRYETVNTATLFATPDFIFMEGSDDNADEMELFLSTNNAAIESFILGGGVIFFNAAPNEGDGMNYAFGETLIYNPGPFCSSFCDAVDGAHTIFQDIGFGPTGTSFGGDGFSHAITGGATSLIEDSSGNTLLGEMQEGLGLAIFGGMTTTNFHTPQPGATNLRENILAYGAANVNPIPEPGAAMLFGVGMITVGAAVRRMREG
jgi:hypothetical protein